MEQAFPLLVKWNIYRFLKDYQENPGAAKLVTFHQGDTYLVQLIELSLLLLSIPMPILR